MIGYWTGLLFSGLTSAAVLIKDAPSSDSLAACPGYKASNVKTTDSGLTADLQLAGDACNIYGDDLTDLVLEVTYESGMSTTYSLGNQLCQDYGSDAPQ